MSKKGGKLMKFIATAAGVAAVGTACYVYKDKIKEFFQKPEIKDKLDSAKTFVTDKVRKNTDDDIFDDAEFFDGDEEDAEDSSNRGYTSINITSEEDSPSFKSETSTPEATVAPAKETAAKEDTVTTEDEDVPFEYEGLSDVSEDEDVLAEETSLDGSYNP